MSQVSRSMHQEGSRRSDQGAIWEEVGQTAMLLRAADARAEVANAVGEGQDVRLEAAGLVGEPLVVDERVVHLSLLEVPAQGGQAESPGVRARHVARRRAGR